jgi:hypothetical protein
MYQFSRAIYRELAPYVTEDKPPSQVESNRELVLRECEAAIERLMTDHRYFARPTRTLFANVRPYFGIGDLPHVFTVIDRNVSFARDFLKREPDYAFETTGIERCCQAMTRKGTPCQRQPLPRSEYCPSHQHLEEGLEDLLELAA